MATKKKSAAKARKIDETTAATAAPEQADGAEEAAPGEAPVLALAISGDLIASADGDGRVVTWRLSHGELASVGTFHDDAKAPVAALAANGSGFVGAGSSLISWAVDGTVLAKAALPAAASNVVVRGALVYVLAGGKLLSFSLPDLAPVGEWNHAEGTACGLDVSDDGKRAIVVRDNKLVEVIDLVEKKSLGNWTRKGRNIDFVSAGFNAKGEVLSVCDGDYRLSRVKDTTGRISGEVLWLEDPAPGPIVFDSTRRYVAVGLAGEDAQLVELVRPARGIFHLDPRITKGSEKTFAGWKRIPTFKALAPGFFVRHGSVEAPPTPATRSALAVGDGGHLLAAGFVSGEIVVADTMTGEVVSNRRGRLSDGRLRARIPVSDVAGSVVDGTDLWILQNDGHVVILDLERHTRREGPQLKLDFEFEGPLSKVVGQLRVRKDAIVAFNRERLLVWSRKDGALEVNRELPKNKGAHVDDDRFLLLPDSSLGHEGFDIVSMDWATGDSKVVCHFQRDETRFAHGNDPHGWVVFGSMGTTAMLTIWAGKGLTVAEHHAFDVVSGELGRALLAPHDANGGFIAEPDFRSAEQPGVAVKNVVTGEEIMRCPYEATDAPSGSPSTYDPETKFVAAAVADPAVAVWRPNARRLVLDGHCGPQVRGLLLRAKSLVARDRGWIRLWDVGGD